MPTITSMASIKLEDSSQLQELSCLAKRKPSFQGYLSKMDSTGKLQAAVSVANTSTNNSGGKCSKKWCILFRNFLFYFDIETSTRPTGVLLVENCQCGPTIVIRPDYFQKDREGGFYVSSIDSSACSKKHIFLAESRTERDKWISAIKNSSMSKVQQDLDYLDQQHHLIQSQLASTTRELQHLKRQNFESQEDLAHLRASLTIPRRSSSSASSVPRSPTPEYKSFEQDKQEESARILQSYIRGWLIRCRWKRIVHAYMRSPHASLMKKRNQLIWKFIESEQCYVNQLVILNSEFQHQFSIAALSHKPPLSMEQCVNIFRNSNELLLFHQLFLRGLNNQVEKWPVIILGDVLKLFIPMLSIYHQYVGNHTHALEVLFDLKFQPKFKDFVQNIESRHTCNGHRFEELLVSPLKKISCYIQDLQELKAHTPVEHIDYSSLYDMLTELDTIHKAVTDEVSFSENIRHVLKIESRIEGGCQLLLDKEQALVRQGLLSLFRQEDKLLTFSRRGKRRQQNYCFLFSKHFLVTQRLEKKGEEAYRFIKDNGILTLSKCRILEHALPECPELRFLSFGIEYEDGEVKNKLVFIATSIAEKAQWIADIAQCIENEKQNKILQSKSQGQPVELSSKFIRYSTFRTGKEQLVSCGNLDSLLQRLTKVSYFGLDFLNTFLTTFPLYTKPTHVMDFLIKSYYDCLDEKSHRSLCLSLPTEECSRNNRVAVSAVSSASNRTTMPGNSPKMPTRSYSNNKGNRHNDTSGSVSGIFFALRHWICKHFYHFRSNRTLDIKLQEFLDRSCQEPSLSSSEKRVVMEVSQLYMMQKTDQPEEINPVLQHFLTSEKRVLDSFDIVLSWQPRQVAEQLCHIDSVFFSQIENDELLRHLTYKGQNKKDVAPNLINMIQHFNKMSMFWMWAVTKQQNEIDSGKVIRFLINLAMECYQLNNFLSTMQLLGALEHSTVMRFTEVFENLPKTLKTNLRTLRKLGSTDGRYKELKKATRLATPPLIPYLPLTMNELVWVSESAPNYTEGDLVNFTKMRRYTRIIHSLLQHQKEPYDLTFDPEISIVFLSTELPGDENVLYEYVDTLTANLKKSPTPPLTEQ